MDNKNNTLFEKLDEQGKQIESVASKLDGINIKDLHALAKRTYAYKDYQTAQKYFSHINLLDPLDWESALYASLCNFKGYHNFAFWYRVPEQLQPIVCSTLKYINDLSLPKKEKEKQLAKCSSILTNELESFVGFYFENAKSFNDVGSEYVKILETVYIDIINEIKNIKSPSIKKMVSELAKCCLDLIVGTLTFPFEFSESKYNELLSYVSDANIPTFYVIEEKVSQQQRLETSRAKGLSLEEKRKIQMEGKLVFIFKDLLIKKRHFIKSVTVGILLFIFSILGIIFSVLTNAIFCLIFILSLLESIVLMIKPITEKNWTPSSYIFATLRYKNRLSSNGTIIKEESTKYLSIINIVSLYVMLFGTMSYFTILSFNNKNAIGMCNYLQIACGVICFILHFFALIRLFDLDKFDFDAYYIFKNKRYSESNDLR